MFSMFGKTICLFCFVLVAVVCLACSTVAQAQLPEPVSLWRFQEGSGNTTAEPLSKMRSAARSWNLVRAIAMWRPTPGFASWAAQIFRSPHG